MSNLLIVIVIAVGLVGFFVLAVSLTLIFKGHNIKSEIDQNENLRARGITCTVRQAHESDNRNNIDGCSVSCSDDCGSCLSDRNADSRNDNTATD